MFYNYAISGGGGGGGGGGLKMSEMAHPFLFLKDKTLVIISKITIII